MWSTRCFKPLGEKINFLVNAGRKLYSYLEKDNIKCVPHPVYQTVPWKGLKSKVKNATGQVLEANRGEFLYNWKWGSLSKHDWKSRHDERKRLRNLSTLNNNNKTKKQSKKVTQQKTAEAKSKKINTTLGETIHNLYQRKSIILSMYEALLRTKKKMTKLDRKMSKRQLLHFQRNKCKWPSGIRKGVPSCW